MRTALSGSPLVQHSIISRILWGCGISQTALIFKFSINKTTVRTQKGWHITSEDVFLVGQTKSRVCRLKIVDGLSHITYSTNKLLNISNFHLWWKTKQPSAVKIKASIPSAVYWTPSALQISTSLAKICCSCKGA
jgi:hypothetical protein